MHDHPNTACHKKKRKRQNRYQEDNSPSPQKALLTQNSFVLKAQRTYESCHSFLLTSLSLGRGVRGTHLCGPPLRRSLEHGGRCRPAPLLPRARAGAQHDVVLHWYGTLGLSDTAHVESGELSCGGAPGANGPPGLTLAPAERWFHHQTVDESPAITYVGPTPDVTLHAAPETAIRHVVPVSAVTCTSPAPVIEYVAPTLDASLDETCTRRISTVLS